MLKTILKGWSGILKRPVADSWPILFLYALLSLGLYLLFPLFAVRSQSETVEMYSIRRLIISIFLPAILVYCFEIISTSFVAFRKPLLIIFDTQRRREYLKAATWLDWLGNFLALIVILFFVRSWSGGRIDVIPHSIWSFVVFIIALSIYVVMTYKRDNDRQKILVQSSTSTENT